MAMKFPFPVLHLSCCSTTVLLFAHVFIVFPLLLMSNLNEECFDFDEDEKEWIDILRS